MAGKHPALGIGEPDRLRPDFLQARKTSRLCAWEHSGNLCLKVLRAVEARLRRLVGIIEELSFTTVRHRLIALLVRLGKSEAKAGSGTVALVLPANNTELAAQIGHPYASDSRAISAVLQAAPKTPKPQNPKTPKPQNPQLSFLLNAR